MSGWRSCPGPIRGARIVSYIIQTTVLFAALLPGTLIGVAVLEATAFFGLPRFMTDNGLIIAWGSAARFAGLALVVLAVARDSTSRHFREMADVDGAGVVDAWRHVSLPLSWPVWAGAFLLTAMFSLTELAAALVLLPPGVPSFTQRLVNQMHYARDQHVIESCLALVGTYLVLAVLIVKACTRRRAGAAAALFALLMAAGCGSETPPGLLAYPWGIAVDEKNRAFVVDGGNNRIQVWQL